MAVLEHTTIIEGETVPFALVLRENQKNIYIRISANGNMTVSAPRSAGMQSIQAAISGRSEWIARHLLKIQKRLSAVKHAPSVLYCGQELSLRLSEHADRRPKLDIKRKTLTAKNSRSVELWLKGMAERIIRFRVRRISEKTGIGYTSISIRNQKTRWGSSSSRGTITVNWRIVMAPPEVQHYLIIHELVHQIYPNHSDTYWRKVAELCPDYRSHNRWLNRNNYINGLFREEP